MLVIELHEPNQPPRTLSFTRQTLGIGRGLPGLTLGADIGLVADGVLAQHLELFEREGHLLLSPNAVASVTLNGKPCSEVKAENDEQLQIQKQFQKRLKPSIEIQIGSVIGFGSATIVVVGFTPILPPDFEIREAIFLHAMSQDLSSVGERQVYADALEDSGWLIRAEYLRVQLRLLLREAVDGDEGAKNRYLKNLLPAWTWVTRVGEPAFAQGCVPKLGRACPVAWGSAVRPSVCAKCDRAVRFASR